LILVTAIENSRLDQTYNTPALVTLMLLDEQLKWMNANGGLKFAAGRSADSASRFTDGLKRPATQLHLLQILHSVLRLLEQLTLMMQSMPPRLLQPFAQMELWIQSHIASLVRTSFVSVCSRQSTQLILMH
jgi:hypothetical protein